MLSCIMAFGIADVRAQGIVSLSEEAMFDDELETNSELPELETPKKVDVPAKEEPAPAKVVAPNAPAEAPKIAPKIAPKVPETSKEVAVESKTVRSPLASDNSSLFGSKSDTGSMGNDLFNQMSDIEKRTALLNLELRREKLQNEIEAVKIQRQQALLAEEEKVEAQRLKNIEFEKEQERKVLIEQEKLRELDIQFEKLRQEKLLSSYKNKMLEENQKWIEHNADFYKQIEALRKSKKDLTAETKQKLEQLQQQALAAKEAHLAKVDELNKKIIDQQSQLKVLRTRIETLEKEKEEARRNPFAGVEGLPVAVPGAAGGLSGAATDVAPGSDISNEEEPVETDLSKLYAVTEIRGQGGELIAKLVNKGGTSFYVKKGTVLQSGHTIGDITLTYVTAEKENDKKYLYFAAGGILPTETSTMNTDEDGKKGKDKKGKSK